MNGRNLILLCLLPALLMNCGPDAKHDNPLDPVYGGGVGGTLYSLRGIPVADALVSASPGNLVTRSNSSGQFSLELNGGQTYVLSASRLDYLTNFDTIAVPADGRLEHNMILKGVPRLTGQKVLTLAIHDSEGQLPVYLLPQCIGSLADGEGVLDRHYSLKCNVNGTSYLPDSSRALDQESRRYYWSILDTASILTFTMDSAGTAVLPPTPVTVPASLGWPAIISPTNNSTFQLPDTMRWSNADVFVVVRIEIWKDTAVAWQKDTSNIQQLFCNAALEGGREYLWRVINTDISGNRAVAESKFYVPINK